MLNYSPVLYFVFVYFLSLTKIIHTAQIYKFALVTECLQTLVLLICLLQKKVDSLEL